MKPRGREWYWKLLDCPIASSASPIASMKVFQALVALTCFAIVDSLLLPMLKDAYGFLWLLGGFSNAATGVVLYLLLWAAVCLLELGVAWFLVIRKIPDLRSRANYAYDCSSVACLAPIIVLIFGTVATGYNPGASYANDRLIEGNIFGLMYLLPTFGTISISLFLSGRALRKRQ